jgi:hypothetical protein
MESEIIQQTEKWIKSVVIDLNFCPFAAKALLKKSVRYVVLKDADVKQSLEALVQEFEFLNDHEDIETTFIIFANDFVDFKSYLQLVKKAESTITKEDYDGIYQVASFHPNYCFAGSDSDDAANYTNRSIYPMLHVLREDSLTKALALYPSPELIPEHNIALARQKGLQYMQMLRVACMS